MFEVMIVPIREHHAWHSDLRKLFAVDAHADTAHIVATVAAANRRIASAPGVKADADTGLGAFLRQVDFRAAIVLAAGPSVRMRATARILTGIDQSDDGVGRASVIDAETVGWGVSVPVATFDLALERERCHHEAIIEVW